MEEVLNLIDRISIETLAVALIVFLLTMVVKIPIKKLTGNLTEEKRKAINSVILIVPGIISVIVNLIFILITKSNFNLLIDRSINSWIVSLSIYAIYERVVLIIKGLNNSDLDKENIKEVKKEIKQLVSKLDSDEGVVKELNKEIDKLEEYKKKIDVNNLTKLFSINVRIENLKTKKTSLEEQIKENNEKIQELKGE